MTKVYTVGCWQCREFHAYQNDESAEDHLDAMQNHGCPHDGNHDNLGIIVMNSERVPMWEKP